MKTKLVVLLLNAFLIISGLSSVKAQVTIGSGKTPETFSVLELESNGNLGLRLPQMTTQARDNLATTSGTEILMSGLLIYNLDTKCQEYWNNTKWVSLCLGTANITLDGDGCDYETLGKLPADGLSGTCNFTPEDKPACTVSNGQAYQVYLTAGSSYTFLTVDPITSAFSVQFSENNSSSDRIAVVRVVNNCSGEFTDFPFVQAGGTCPTAANPNVELHNTDLCWNGAAYAYVTNPEDGINYIWEKSGTIVNTGISYQITLPGIYKIYAGLLGCGTPAQITVTDQSSTPAPSAPRILVDNDGIICGSGSVQLTAIGFNGGDVYWFKDGVRQNNTPASFIVVSGSGSVGEWFAVVSDAGHCASLPSNKINISYQESETSLVKPQANINGVAISSNTLLICGGGTLKLEVTNPNDYAGLSPTYEWYANGQIIGSTSSTELYVVPPELEEIVISLTVSVPGVCPVSISSANSTVTKGSTPAATNINNRATTAYICSATPATLIAAARNGYIYEWFRDGISLGEQTGSEHYILQTTEVGRYSVRYANAAGCWSEASAEIDVVQSAALNLSWAVAPVGGAQGDGILETVKTYGVTAIPDPLSFTWEGTPSNLAEILPIGNGSSAMVKYGNTPGTYLITVTATNACGETSITSEEITIRSGCIPLSSLNIAPNTEQTVTQNQSSLSFSASAAGAGSPVSGYEWILDGNAISGSSSTLTNTYTTPSDLSVGTHTIYCKIYNCDSNGSSNSNAPKQTATVTIIVKRDPTLLPDAPESVSPYFYGQKTCLDVRQTAGPAFVQSNTIPDDQNPWKGGRLPLEVRPDDFRNGKAFAYNFTGTGISAASIEYSVIDPSEIVKSVSGNGTNIATITFIDDIVALSTTKTKSTAFRVTLYAAFMANSTMYKEKVEITIQDGACGCPALVAANVYKMDYCFACGAGADAASYPKGQYTGDPFVMSPTTYGAYYKWGSKYPAATYNVQNLRQTTSSTALTWGAANNPCPSGWKPMTWSELNYFAGSGARFAIQSQNTTGYRGQLRGMVPVCGGGYRIYAAGNAYVGAVVEADNCHTWSYDALNTANANNKYFYRTGDGSLGLNYTKNYGEHVRCVQEGSTYGSNGY